ncbi:MAG: response regulator [Candidatus Omnitrophica bacterium]|nr:response regulator [Candidatus Omnitrophota bacterium]
MSRQSIFIATDNTKSAEFLTTYFSETQSIPTLIRSKADLSVLFSCQPDLVFIQGDWMDQRVVNRLKQFKLEHPKIKYFSLGNARHDGFAWDGVFELPFDEKVFRKIVLAKVELPNPIKLLLVDDESEIIEVMQDYFEVRTDPPFNVRTAFNGLEGFKLIEQDPPHCLVLDIKMPVRTGVELFRDLAKAGQRIPTIIFIDSTTADDIIEIRKYGAPIFVEKGGPASSMPDMLALVKKLVAFS